MWPTVPYLSVTAVTLPTFKGSKRKIATKPSNASCCAVVVANSLLLRLNRESGKLFAGKWRCIVLAYLSSTWVGLDSVREGKIHSPKYMAAVYGGFLDT